LIMILVWVVCGRVYFWAGMCDVGEMVSAVGLRLWR